MDIRHITRAGLVVMAALLLLVTFALVVAPVGGKAAYAQEAAKPAVTSAPAAEAAPAEAAKEGAAAEAEAEIPHKVGNPTPAQLVDLRMAWESIPGFDLLVVGILGLVATVGVIGFGAFKQSRV